MGNMTLRVKGLALLCLVLLACSPWGHAEVIRMAIHPRIVNAEVQQLHRQHLAQGPSSSQPEPPARSPPSPQNDARASNDSVPGIPAVETWLYSGEGSHTVKAIIGGQEQELILDTGSGKTAFICEGCDHCGRHHHESPFRFTPTTAYATCTRLEETTGSCLRCEGNRCQYGQEYVEGDFWLAYKVRDRLSFPGNPSLGAVVDFGCIYQQNGVFNHQSSNGIMGFSNHPDAIFEQFYRHGVTHSRLFSHCLADSGGSITLGGVDLDLNDTDMMYTPLRSTGYQYWTVELHAMHVGTEQVQVDATVFNRDRGCVFDSGTTFIYLPTAALDPFVHAWKAATGNAFVPTSSKSYHLSPEQVTAFPPVCFEFAGHATICVPPTRYFARLESNLYGGTLFFSDSVKSTIIGASALTDYNVVYDMDNQRLGMAHAICERDPMDEETHVLHTIEMALYPQQDRLHRLMDPMFSSWSHGIACVMLALGAVMLVVNALSNRMQLRELQGTTDENALPAPHLLHAIAEDDEAFAFHLMDNDDC